MFNGALSLVLAELKWHYPEMASVRIVNSCLKWHGHVKYVVNVTEKHVINMLCTWGDCKEELASNLWCSPDIAYAVKHEVTHVQANMHVVKVLPCWQT